MTDQIVRAMTNDGAFRIIAARSTDTVAPVLKAQNVSGKTARILGELVTGAAIYRETMAPTLRVQCVLSGAKGSQLIADSHPDGWCRGIASLRGNSEFSLGDGAHLQMMRSMPNGSLNRGTVSLDTGANVSDAITGYMKQSEQIDSYVSVRSVLTDSGHVAASGGFLVQLLPEAPDNMANLSILTARLELDFADYEQRLLKTDADPMDLVKEVFYGFEHTILEEKEISYGCNCSMTRILSGISTIAKSEIQSMIDDGETLQIECDYCAKEYRVEPAQLVGLLGES